MRAPKKHFIRTGQQNQVPSYRYGNNVAGMTIGTLTKSLQNVSLEN